MITIIIMIKIIKTECKSVSASDNCENNTTKGDEMNK